MICKNCGALLSEKQDFCSQCGSATGDSVAEIVIIDSKNNRRSSAYPKILLGLILFGGVFYFFEMINRHFHPVIADQPSIGYGISSIADKIPSSTITAAVDETYITVSVEDVVNHRIVRFFDPSGVQDIPILAYITPRGKIVTAIGLSESCRSTDFYLEGNTIHCANCPSYWNMESLEAYACCQKYYPDPIHSIVEGGLLKIEKEDVQQWKARL
ncbi:MAG: Fe-S-containing protein [Bacteroidota bacterium]|jgi:hypothetical protein